jgi:ribose transport system permease protein
MLLAVDYRPAADHQVSAVRAASREIWMPGTIDDFQVGDTVRYYGGRRAANAQVVIDRVRSEPQGPAGEGGPFTVLTVNQSLSNNDRYGHVTRIHPVTDFDRGSTGNLGWVTLAGQHAPLHVRDQLTLVNPSGGIRQLRIVDVQGNAPSKRLVLSDQLGSEFDGQWVAVPLYRHQRMPVVVAVALVLAMTALLGTVHGLLITKIGLQSFVVTLCGLLFYRGIARWLVSDQPQGFGNEYQNSLSLAATGKLPLPWQPDGLGAAGIPYPLFIMLAIALAGTILLNHTVWGRYMLALGRNREAAEYSGIRTDRIAILAYILSTTLAGIGGMLFALDANSVSPSSFGNFFELYAIAAAVLGGCSLRGGEGTILGVIIGTAVMQTLYNLIVLLKISDRLEFAIIGAVILIGVMADELLRRYAAKRRARSAQAAA